MFVGCRPHQPWRYCAAFVVLLTALLFSVGPASGETIYAATGRLQSSPHLLRFDSASPEQVELDVPIVGLWEELEEILITLDLDPASGTLFGAGLACSNVPLEPCGLIVYTIDPESGQVIGAVSGLSPGTANGAMEGDLHPATGDLRLAVELENVRIGLPSGGAVYESPLTPAGETLAIAHGPNSPGAANATTYALWRANAQAAGELVTLGGPGGVPPAASGIVTPIAPLGRNLEPYLGFDISPLGRAYFSQAPVGAPGAGAHLYTIDLATAATTDLGAIGGGGRDVTALAVAVRGQPAQAIPTLGPWPIALLAVLLAWMGIDRLGRRRVA